MSLSTLWSYLFYYNLTASSTISNVGNKTWVAAAAQRQRRNCYAITWSVAKEDVHSKARTREETRRTIAKIHSYPYKSTIPGWPPNSTLSWNRIQKSVSVESEIDINDVSALMAHYDQQHSAVVAAMMILFGLLWFPIVFVTNYNYPERELTVNHLHKLAKPFVVSAAGC